MWGLDGITSFTPLLDLRYYKVLLFPLLRRLLLWFLPCQRLLLLKMRSLVLPKNARSSSVQFLSTVIFEPSPSGCFQTKIRSWSSSGVLLWLEGRTTLLAEQFVMEGHL
jgi:hypothetical protein